MELTEEELETVAAVLTEKREALETAAQRAIKRMTIYQKSPDCMILSKKVKKTIDGNMRRIAAIDRIIGKMKL